LCFKEIHQTGAGCFQCAPTAGAGRIVLVWHFTVFVVPLGKVGLLRRRDIYPCLS
jgi:hypothetical protein